MFLTILTVFICLTFYVQKNKFYFENGFWKAEILDDKYLFCLFQKWLSFW